MSEFIDRKADNLRKENAPCGTVKTVAYVGQTWMLNSERRVAQQSQLCLDDYETSNKSTIKGQANRVVRW